MQVLIVFATYPVVLRNQQVVKWIHYWGSTGGFLLLHYSSGVV